MDFFNILGKKQTYNNIIYLLLSFPLGTFYFVFLVAGLSIGFSLIITWVGIPIILGTIYCSLKLMEFEKGLAKSLLNTDIKDIPCTSARTGGIFTRFKNHMKDPYTWKSIGYLFLKFPLGVASFCIVIVLMGASVGAISIPILYHLRETGVISSSVRLVSLGYTELVSTYSSAFLVCFIGIVFMFLSLRIINMWAQKINRIIIKSL